MEEVIRYQDHWYILAGSSRADGRRQVLKHNDTFGLYDRFGDVQPIGASGAGLYHEGTRFLSLYELTINGKRPFLLNSSVKQDNTLLTVDLTPPEQRKESEAAIPEGRIHLFRSKLLWHGVQYEHLRVSNYASRSAQVRLLLAYGADYTDIFEARGAHREHRGVLLEPVCEPQRVELGYRGLDGALRRTAIIFSILPERLTPNEAEFSLTLASRDHTDFYITVACANGGDWPALLSYEESLRRQGAHYRAATQAAAAVTTSNTQFNDWLDRSAADLRMLVTDTPHGPYPYAGVPWFSTAFGRDGIITALQTLWIDPGLARGVLAYLAATQATAVDDSREAQPGKILHETRSGEMAALNEIPFGHYYGTVDATPLFVVLAGAYYQRTGDRAHIERIWPHVRAAIDWCDRWGDLDGDGFVEYQRHGNRGLVQQGWKDSEDSVFHADGTWADGPIALCEVQGYVYDAKRSAARLARLLGEDDYADALEQAARTLRERFNAAFWDEELGTYALALDGDKRPCRIRTSNAGHVLFSGIADPDKAACVADTLLCTASFNGWGVRTVAAGEPRYNPMAYHNGSMWPHDNAIIAMGLARYGLKGHALRILDGLFAASTALDLHRLPELFCGFDALPGMGPTLYPVACSPQAWAAGTVFHLLQAVLGMNFRAEKPQLRFHYPQLPAWLQRVEIANLRLGDGVVDITLHRHPRDVGVNVTRREGDVEITVVM